MLCFFFFQAEDGIRGLTVTGVQTCALPIYPRPISPGAAGGHGTCWNRGAHAAAGPDELRLRGCGDAGGRRPAGGPRRRDGVRSEERRVGKECRYPSSAYAEVQHCRVTALSL